MLRTTAKRISRDELETVIEQAPRFRAKWLTDEELDRVCAQYTAITGARVASPAKRRMVAAACRTVGADFLAVVEAQFQRTDTETNLLVDLRGGRTVGPPRATLTANLDLKTKPDRPAAVRAEDKSAGIARPAGSLDCGCDESLLRPGLIYCARHHPRFDPTSKRRHDRRRSNPDAARFFGDEPPPPGAAG
jgi:hypothetical protein